MPTPRARLGRSARRIQTSLGELLEALVDSVTGDPTQRLQRAAFVLASPTLGRRLSRRIRLVR